MSEGHHFLVLDARRQRVEKVFAHREIFGEGPLTAVITLVVAPDPIARGEAPDGRPNGLDDPGYVPPHDEGEGQVLRQLAAADQGVHRIDADGGGLDEHVGRADRRGGQFAESDVLGGTDRVDVSRFHGGIPQTKRAPTSCGRALRRPPFTPRTTGHG
jgi:hypothetical protein